MKKLVFFNLSLLLMLSPAQNLNLNSLKAQSVSCIENNPYLVKVLDACQSNSEFAKEMMLKVVERIRAKLMCMCNLSEKLELKKFTKTPTLFEKLFSELSRNVAGLLDIEYEKVQTFTKNMQSPNTKPEDSNKKSSPTNLQCTDSTQVKNLVDRILRISDDKLNLSISLVMHFLNPSSTEQINNEQIKRTLIQTLESFTTEELNALERVIDSKAFAKIAPKLDELTGIVLSVIKEDAGK
jgi:hypothetical protein